jgi:hypothetical protein
MFKNLNMQMPIGKVGERLCDFFYVTRAAIAFKPI